MIRDYLVILMLLATGTSLADEAYQSQEDFLLEAFNLSLIHISEPTRPELVSRMPSSA